MESNRPSLSSEYARTLEYMELNVPALFERCLADLKGGRHQASVGKQALLHLLGNMTVLSAGYIAGALDQRDRVRCESVLMKFEPLVDRLREVANVYPQIHEALTLSQRSS